MKRRGLVFVCLALFGACILAGDKDETEPVLTREVQPEYGPDLQKSFVLDPVEVQMVVDQDGVPFSLTARGDLPDNVVRALAQWRYRPAKENGEKVGFRSMMIVPVRRPLTEQTETYLRRIWQPPTAELSDALKAGAALDPAGAARIEQSLDSDPQDTEGRRITLVAYYAGALAKGAKAEDVRRARARHIAWLVQNRPDLAILGSSLAIINARGEPLADPQGCDQVRQLWITQLNLQPLSIDVTEHATNFLRIADPERAERALVPWLSKNERAVIWLGDLYGLAALGVTSLDPRTGFPATAAAQLPDSALARKARTELNSVNDARLLFSGLAAVSLGGRALSKAGQLPAGYAAFCEELLGRAKQMLPATSASCDPAAPLPDTESQAPRGVPGRVRVGGNVQQTKLLKQIRPPYPQEAKSRHIQGVVKFNAVIGREGKIARLSLVSGPLAFYDSARAAVLQWEYTPTLLNGQPVEVATVIEVNYTLGKH